MGYRVAGAGSRFEGSTRHSMVVRDCPLCRWDGGTGGGGGREETGGKVRRMSPLPLRSVFSSVFFPASAPEVTTVQAVSLLALK